MKKRIFLLLICLLTLTVSLCLFTACKNDEKSEISFKTLTVDGTNVSGTVPNATTEFSFLNEVEAKGGAKFVVALDENGMQTVVTKKITLIPGDNTVYVIETLDGEATEVYKVVIRRKPICEVTFDTKGGTAVDSQQVEEGGFANVPETPILLGYDFTGWNFDFTVPITANTTIKASFKVKSEMSKFNFTSTFSTCEITGIKDRIETNIAIPDYVTSVGKRAFYGCIGLTSVVIPDSVTSIGEDAFAFCASLTSVTIGNGVTTIGSSAFSNCYKLVEVINKSSLNITKGSNSNGYVGCYALEIHNGESKIVNKDGYLFITSDGVNYLLGYGVNDAVLTLPSDYNGQKYKIYNSAFQYCSNLTSVTIPNSVISIGERSFSGCEKLVEVINKSSLNITIGGSDYGWVGFYALEVHNGESKIVNKDGYLFITSGGVNCLVNYIGTDAVLTLPNDFNGKNYKINRCVFYNNEKITSVVIPDSVTSIGYSAFYGCRKLESVVIGNAVNSIGSWAFYNCICLTSIKYRGTETQWNEISKGYDWDYLAGRYTITYNYTGQ